MEVENTIEQAKTRVFQKELSNRHHVLNYTKTMLQLGGDVILPGLGTASELALQWKTIRRVQQQQWQAFVVEAKQLIGRKIR